MTPELKPETPRTSRYTHDADETPVYPWVYASHMATMETELSSALNAAREAIENAPHEVSCSVFVMSEANFDEPASVVCTCWKSAALASFENSSPQTTEKPNHQ